MNRKYKIIIVILAIPLLLWSVLLIDTYRHPSTNCYVRPSRLVDNNKTLCTIAFGKWMEVGVYNDFPVVGGQRTVRVPECYTKALFMGMSCEWAP